MDVNPSSDGAPSLSRKPGLAAVPAQAPYTPKLIVPHTTSNSKPGPRFLSLGAFSLWLGYSRSWAYLHRIRLLRGGLPMYRFGKGLRVDVEGRRFAAWLRKHNVDLNEKRKMKSEKCNATKGKDMSIAAAAGWVVLVIFMAAVSVLVAMGRTDHGRDPEDA